MKARLWIALALVAAVEAGVGYQLYQLRQASQAHRGQTEQADQARRRELDALQKAQVADKEKVDKAAAQLGTDRLALEKRKTDIDSTADKLAEREKVLGEQTTALDSRARALTRRREAADAVRDAIGRVKVAVAARERALTDPDWLKSVAAERDARIAAVEASNPPDGWKAIRKGVLAELIRTREDAVLRGSVETHRLAATVAFELDLLKGFVDRLKLPDGGVPRNEFELLDRLALDALELRWEAKRDELRKRNATSPGSFARAVGEADAKLKALRDAKAKPPIAFTEVGFHLLTAEVEPDALAWVKREAENQDARIREREIQLLKAALARDMTDLQAHLRLFELDPSTTPEHLLRFRQRLVVGRASGFRPAPTTSGAAAELLKTRFADPLAAVGLETRLRLQWYETKGAGRVPFPRWVASHLTAEQLYDCWLYAREADDRLKLLEQKVPDGAGAYLKIDRAAVQEEFEALEAEMKARAGKPEPTIQLGALPSEALQRCAELAAGTALETRDGRQEHFERLRLFQTRTGSNPEAARLSVTLELAGHTDYLAALEPLAQQSREFEATYRKFAGDPKESFDYVDVAESLGECRAKLERAVDDILKRAENPAKAKELLARIKQNLGAFPPPRVAPKASLAYADPELDVDIKTISEDAQALATEGRVLEKAAELAKLTIELSPGGLAHEFDQKTGKRLPKFERMTANERLRYWTKDFAEDSTEREIDALLHRLTSIKAGDGLERSAFDDGKYTEVLADKYETNVTYLGKDKFGDEVYKVGDNYRVIHPNGVNCPVYIPGKLK